MKEYRLGDVCVISKGKSITRATTVEGEVPVIGGGLGPTYFHNTANRKPPVITISASGANAGFVNFWDKPIWASDCTTISEKSNSPALIGYIHKHLQSIQDFINTELRRGSAQPHVYPTDIAEIVIALPSLEKQAEIVAKLDSAFNEIELLEQNILLAESKSNDLQNSLLSSVLNEKSKTFQSGKLGDLGKWITGSTPSTMKKEFWGGDVPFVTPADLNASGELGVVSRRISKLGSQQVRIVDAPSVLVVCIGATLGKVALSDKVITTNQQINTLQVDIQKTNPKYVMHLLSSSTTQKKLWGSATGTTVPILNKGNLENIAINIPSLKEQNVIVDRLDDSFIEIESLRNKIRERRNSVSALRQSLLSSSFTNVKGVA